MDIDLIEIQVAIYSSHRSGIYALMDFLKVLSLISHLDLILDLLQQFVTRILHHPILIIFNYCFLVLKELRCPYQRVIK